MCEQTKKKTSQTKHLGCAWSLWSTHCKHKYATFCRKSKREKRSLDNFTSDRQSDSRYTSIFSIRFVCYETEPVFTGICPFQVCHFHSASLLSTVVLNPIFVIWVDFEVLVVLKTPEFFCNSIPCRICVGAFHFHCWSIRGTYLICSVCHSPVSLILHHCNTNQKNNTREQDLIFCQVMFEGLETQAMNLPLIQYVLLFCITTLMKCTLWIWVVLVGTFPATSLSNNSDFVNLS